MRGQINYKGCAITWLAELNGYVWEDQHFGGESEDVFPTVELAKADIDKSYGDGPATPDEIDDLLAQRKLEEQP